jgi:hypothetical protein
MYCVFVKEATGCTKGRTKRPIRSSTNEAVIGLACSRHAYVRNYLTLNLLMTTIVAPTSNASKWQMGFNSAFKGLKTSSLISRSYFRASSQIPSE